MTDERLTEQRIEEIRRLAEDVIRDGFDPSEEQDVYDLAEAVLALLAERSEEEQ